MSSNVLSEKADNPWYHCRNASIRVPFGVQSACPHDCDHVRDQLKYDYMSNQLTLIEKFNPFIREKNKKKQEIL